MKNRFITKDDGSGMYRLTIPLDTAFLLACAKDPPKYNARQMKVMEQKMLAVCLYEAVRQNPNYPDWAKKKIMDALRERWPDIKWDAGESSLME